ncbi:unnamed protein product [Heterosigma akashiwo]
MLSNSIRGQNLAVLELGAKDCKSMYYFGEGCVSQLTLQGNPDKINPGIAKSSGQQLGINSVAIKASAKDLPPIYDFVVCVNGLAELGMSGAEAINLAASVLKPEGTFVFIEQVCTRFWGRRRWTRWRGRRRRAAGTRASTSTRSPGRWAWARPPSSAARRLW